MKEFRDKVAVITGAASGIGFGIAQRCAQEGMKVVLADINQEDLQAAEQALAPSGATTLAVRTDVSKFEEVEALSQKTLDAFGEVHLLVNNAGVGGGGSPWEATLADWQWVMGVNLWGVIHGVKVFVPIMLAQDTECHVVNTASIAGFLPEHVSAPYQVTKHGVVALSENLYHSLAQMNAKVKVSVLCPEWVKTRIADAERNRPVELQNDPASDPRSAEYDAMIADLRRAAAAGMSPQEVADQVLQAIRDEQLYVFTHPGCRAGIQRRMEAVLEHCPD
ncbi:MAG: SDR family NAD(P)-dependent oxidoreductase [Anaerolineae bacterium]|jgi:NAD(P)-dependent dehydrogenase (short-subunit alcohol dehydrogenase family)